jgi:transposase InsO family protein
MERVSKTAVFKVAKAWDAASLESLLEARPELVAATDPKGRTALHMVCNVKPGGASRTTERVHHRIYGTRAEARRDLFQYIEGFYNSRRLHSALGYISPAFAERMAA